jgi:hypothetical protein
MSSTRRDQVLKKLQLQRAEIPAEVSACFDKVFESRVGGLLKYHFEAYPPRIGHLESTIRNFARDAYLQGVLDGVNAVQQRPGIMSILEELHNEPTGGT